jgi:uncharacterized membrane protein
MKFNGYSGVSGDLASSRLRTSVSPLFVPPKAAARLTARQRLVLGLASVSVAAWAAIGVGLVFVVTFGYLSIHRFDHYGQGSFDLGIYDQAFWLIAHGKSPFITLRGMNMWAHHTNLVAYLYAPFYWLGAGPRFLLGSQALVIGLGMIPVYRLTLRQSGLPWLAFAMTLAYSLYAPVQWLTWQTYHPESLAITPILFALLFAEERRWKWFAVACVLALSTREEAGIALAIISVRIACTGLPFALRSRMPLPPAPVSRPLSLTVFRRARSNGKLRMLCNHFLTRDRLVPLITGFACLAYFTVCTKVVIPHFASGKDPYYIEGFFGSWGRTTTDIFWHAVTHPFDVFRAFTTSENVIFIGLMFFCLGGLGLAAPSWALLAGPFLFWNAISSHSATRNIQFQYTIFTIPFVVMATIAGASRLFAQRTLSTDGQQRVARFRKPLGPLRFGALLVAVAATIGTQLAVSPNPVSSWGASFWNTGGTSRDFAVALSYVRPTDRVAASTLLSTRISGRVEIFDFPNPFVPHYFGLDVASGIDPNSVNVLVLMRRNSGTTSPKTDAATLDFLLRKRFFSVVYETNDVLVARKTRLVSESDATTLRTSVEQFNGL